MTIQNFFSSLNFFDFQKATLSRYQGDKAQLKNILYKKIELKSGLKIQTIYRYQTRDITKNYSWDEFLAHLKIWFSNSEFQVLNLFESKYQKVAEWKKNLLKVKVIENQVNILSSLDHNRTKKREISQAAPFLLELGICSQKGEVLAPMQDKYKQINRYIEIIGPYVQKIENKITIVDLGSGKGYLTFALHHFLVEKNRDVHSIGIEFRRELVDFCNQTALKLQFQNLQFIEGRIAEYSPQQLDVCIALHACNTATDDAIFLGIAKSAKLIVVAPCCHQQVRKSMEKAKLNPAAAEWLSHGVFLERMAEMLTDIIRVWILEMNGYRCKTLEFISDTHTPKNVMLIAEKVDFSEKKAQEYQSKIEDLMVQYGIKNHYLLDKIKKIK